MALKQMRVRCVTRHQRQYGYVGYEKVSVQRLQVKQWWGWKTIDEEIVPNDVLISLGCLGDTGGWVSKFAILGTFGRDGIIIPN